MCGGGDMGQWGKPLLSAILAKSTAHSVLNYLHQALKLLVFLEGYFFKVNEKKITKVRKEMFKVLSTESGLSAGGTGG